MPQIQTVSWDDLSRWLQSVAERTDYDSIVGVSRSGAAIAIGLSYLRPDLPLHYVYRCSPQPTREPFYVFRPGRQQRFDHTLASMRISDCFQQESPLVLDDVATFGDTLAVSERLLVNAGARSVKFALYALDRKVLARENPEILNRADSAAQVDNSQVWLQFPWQSLGVRGEV